MNKWKKGKFSDCVLDGLKISLKFSNDDKKFWYNMLHMIDKNKNTTIATIINNQLTS